MRHVDEGRVHAWLDGELPGPGPDGARELERHLAACAACRAMVEEERAIRDRASALLRTADPGPAADPRVVPLPVPARRRAPRRAWIAAGWAASIVLALGIGWMARPAPREQLAIDAVTVSAPARAPATPQSADPATVAEPAPSLDPAAVPDVVPPGLSPAASPPRAAPAARPPVRPAAPPAAMAPPEAPRAAAARERVARRAEGERAAERLRERAPAAEGYYPLSRRSTGLRGTVTDADGRPVPGAVVTVPSLAVTARTDADGSYALSLPASRMAGADTLVVHAQRLGMRGEEQRVALGPGASRRVDFSLEPAALALEGLAVTATGAPAEALADAAPSRGEVAMAPPPPPPPAPSPARRGVAWRTTDRAEAERQLGRSLVTAPDLPVVAIELGLVEGGTAVRVRQRLPDGEVLSLVQRRPRRGLGFAPSADPMARAAAELGGAGLVLEQDGVVVEVTAPLAPDSLRRLLKPIRRR